MTAAATPWNDRSIRFTAAIRTESEMNQRDHRMVVWRRSQAQHKCIEWLAARVVLRLVRRDASGPLPRRSAAGTPIAIARGMLPPLLVGAWQRQQMLAMQARLRREIAAERVRQALEAMRVT